SAEPSGARPVEFARERLLLLPSTLRRDTAVRQMMDLLHPRHRPGAIQTGDPCDTIELLVVIGKKLVAALDLGSVQRNSKMVELIEERCSRLVRNTNVPRAVADTLRQQRQLVRGTHAQAINDVSRERPARKEQSRDRRKEAAVVHDALGQLSRQ